MNDADLGDDIDQHAADVEEQLVTNDETHLNPRYDTFGPSLPPNLTKSLSDACYKPMVVCLLGLPHDRGHPWPCRFSF